MLKTLRLLVIRALVAVIACGNGLSFAASAMQHITVQDTATNVAGIAASVSPAAHDHSQHHHSQPSSHDHHAMAAHSSAPDPSAISDHSAMTEPEPCNGANCLTDDQPSEPCCHTQGHCCLSFVTLPPAANDLERVQRDSAMLFDAGQSVPPGAIIYPLLRPPRAAV